jgi:pyruvate,water dikinase
VTRAEAPAAAAVAASAAAPSGASLPTGYVVATGECAPEHLPIVGGKAVGLGSLIRAGQQVPRSFVVTSSAYLDYVASIADTPNGAAGNMPAALRAEIEAAYLSLCEARQVDELPVAVRSSATIEDSSEASCAGQFRTFLGAAGPSEVVAEVERCFLSAFEPHVGSYRAEREIESEHDGVAVIVQELVDARCSGVMFTRHPRTGDRSLVVIESSYGLGEAVVGGEVTPDLFEVNKIIGQVHSRMMGTKKHEHRLAGDHHAVAEHEVEESRRDLWSLDDEEIESLLAMARDLERQLGKGLDVEWAIGSTAGSHGAEELFALQVRPITVDPRRAEAAVVVSHGAVDNPIDAVLGRLAGRAR